MLPFQTLEKDLCKINRKYLGILALLTVLCYQLGRFTSLLSVPTDSRVGKEEGLGYEEVVEQNKLQ